MLLICLLSGFFPILDSQSTWDQRLVKGEQIFDIALQRGTVQEIQGEFGLFQFGGELRVFHGVHECFAQDLDPCLWRAEGEAVR